MSEAESRPHGHRSKHEQGAFVLNLSWKRLPWHIIWMPRRGPAQASWDMERPQGFTSCAPRSELNRLFVSLFRSGARELGCRALGLGVEAIGACRVCNVSLRALLFLHVIGTCKNPKALTWRAHCTNKLPSRLGDTGFKILS